MIETWLLIVVVVGGALFGEQITLKDTPFYVKTECLAAAEKINKDAYNSGTDEFVSANCMKRSIPKS